jgi:hypothetical protein
MTILVLVVAKADIVWWISEDGGPLFVGVIQALKTISVD